MEATGAVGLRPETTRALTGFDVTGICSTEGLSVGFEAAALCASDFNVTVISARGDTSEDDFLIKAGPVPEAVFESDFTRTTNGIFTEGLMVEEETPVAFSLDSLSVDA